MTTHDPCLTVSGLSAWYGAAKVLFDVDLEVATNGVTALIGRNGAGKTSTLKSIVGLMPRAEGSVTFRSGETERELLGTSTSSIARLGVGYVPEDRRIYPDMTVLENLQLGRFQARGDRTAVAIDEILETFPLLAPITNRSGGVLSGGEQQLLSIARTMIGRPTLLLLDEPSEGLAPVIVEQLHASVLDLRRNYDVSVLLVEQNAPFALSLATDCTVLENGTVVFSGSADELRGRDDLVREYMGL